MTPCPLAETLKYETLRTPVLGVLQGGTHVSPLKVTYFYYPRLSQNHDTKCPPFGLKCLDPGSGRKIPAIYMHGTDANPGVLYPRNLVLSVANFVSWF